MKWLNFLLIGLILSACSSKQLVSQPDVKSNEITEKKWRIIELGGESVPEEINEKMPFIFLSSENNHITGNAGCNVINGSFKLSENNHIEFYQLISTMMACMDMETEARLKKALEQADNYSVGEGTLSLNKGRMAPLARFQIVNETSLSGTWDLSYVTGAEDFESIYSHKTPFITIDENENKANGNTGCNSFNSSLVKINNNIKFSLPITTRMFCEGNGEALFLDALKKINRFAISDDGKTLNLLTGDIAVMRLVRK